MHIPVSKCMCTGYFLPQHSLNYGLASDDLTNYSLLVYVP